MVVIVPLFISRGLETLSNLKWKRIASPEGSSKNDVRMGRGGWMLQVMFVDQIQKWTVGGDAKYQKIEDVVNGNVLMM